MTPPGRDGPAHSTEGFLAPPGQVADWRAVVLVDAALDTGLLDVLPADADQAAERLGLEPHAVRVALDALREFGIVEKASGHYRRGPAVPDEATAATLRHHARVVRGWSTSLGERLAGCRGERRERSPAELESWLIALARTARDRAPEVADHCLDRFPHARRLLDLAGGHGEYGLEFARRGLEVTLQDLPRVIDIVGGWDALRGVSVRLEARDVFDGLAPGPFDLVLCAGFTHTLAPEANAELFPRLASVIAPDGGVAVVTYLRGRRPVAPLFAVQMLVTGGGGDTYSRDEYAGWLAAGGFDGLEAGDLPQGPSILTAVRAVDA